jgi:hypothetical protein
MTDSIPKKVMQGVGEIGVETIKEGTKQATEVLNTIITGQELVGNARPMSEEEMAKARAEDERKKEEELEKIKNISGRNVEAEIKEIVVEKENSEEDKEKEFLEKIRVQREIEERERENLVDMPGNVKREAAKTQFTPGKRKKQQPDASQMSQTSEFKGGKID